MVSLVIWTLVFIPVTYLLGTCLSLARNIQRARKSGIQYVLVPFFSYNRLLMVISRPILRCIDNISPNPRPTSWRYLIKSTWSWKLGHKPFAQLGSDTFLTVAPGGNILFSADADVITQITTRGADFPKPIFLYRSVDIYGKNIVSSEGMAWRYHRKLTSPAFSENTNRLVWEEALDQCQKMLKSWLEADGKVKGIHGDAMRLSLNVISRAGLGRKMDWVGPTQESKTTSDVGNIPDGHIMSFTYSLRYLLDHILLVMLLPKWLLSNYPSQSYRTAYKSYEELGKYMKDLIDSKKAAVHETGELLAVDILGQLVKGQESKEDERSRAFLADSEVMGNLFMFMIAGHETSANTIQLSILFLALHPHIQRKVQAELDSIFQSRPISHWSYDVDLPHLINGMLGAVLHETLRLVPPVSNIPKHVASSTPQPLKIGDKTVSVPAHTMIRLCVPSVHRNPKYWPQAPRPDSSRPICTPGDTSDDLDKFKPERWLGSRNYTPHDGDEEGESHLFTPQKGSYIPFSDGPRACLGKRFAQVEIVAALATIFHSHSVELDVGDGGATAGEVHSGGVEGMTREEKKQLWNGARDRANRTWRQNMTLVITLQLSGDKGRVPLRVVRRGEERFFHV